MKHSKYLDKLRDNKFKHLNMNHRDRDAFLKYISDTNTTCSNVKRRTRRQLNPDQCKFNQLIFFNSFSFSFFGYFAMSRSLKFIYSEKATKFCEISTLLLFYVVPVKSKVEISQNFVAFSEYMNFI